MPGKRNFKVDCKASSSGCKSGVQRGTAGGRSGLDRTLVHGKTTYQAISAAVSNLGSKICNIDSKEDEIVNAMLNPAVAALLVIIKNRTEELIEAISQCTQKMQPDQIRDIFLLSVNLYCLRRTYCSMTLEEIPEQKRLRGISLSLLEVYRLSAEATGGAEAVNLLNTLKGHLQTDSTNFDVKVKERSSETRLGNADSSYFDTDNLNITMSTAHDVVEFRNEIFLNIRDQLLPEYNLNNGGVLTFYNFKKFNSLTNSAEEKGKAFQKHVEGFNSKFESRKRELNEIIKQKLELLQQRNGESGDWYQRSVRLYKRATGKQYTSSEDPHYTSWLQRITGAYQTVAVGSTEGNYCLMSFLSFLEKVADNYLSCHKADAALFTSYFSGIAASYEKLRKKSNVMKLQHPKQECLPEFSGWYDLVSSSINKYELKNVVSIEDVASVYLKLPGDTSPSFMSWFEGAMEKYSREYSALITGGNKELENPPNSSLIDASYSNIKIEANNIQIS